MIRLIVGLGNPGDQYAKTRHNAGFWLLDKLVEHAHESWHEEKKFFGQYCKIFINNQPIHLLKPSTFMNASGKAVTALANFYDIHASDILVIHDELDIPEGTIKMKVGGGHGGHNGLRDIISAIGTKEFMRLRLGVDHPGEKSEVINYVLKAPSKEGRMKIDAAIAEGERAIEILIKDNAEKAIHWLHSKK